MTEKREFLLFSDASFDPQLKVGVGAILILAREEGKLKTARDDLVIQTKVIESENIARLEILTALWGIEEIKRIHKGRLTTQNATITLYSDCRAIENLLTRRTRLEERNFQNKAGSQLANADLYRTFFFLYDELPFAIIWVKGHSPTKSQSDIQRVFSHVDRAARHALRKHREQQG